jgi:DNA-binding XRE family transcriptional regulator
MDSLELRRLRFELGYNQKELAGLLGVSAQTVCNWEVSRHAISNEYANKIRLLGKSPDFIGVESKKKMRTIIRIFKSMDKIGRSHVIGILGKINT